MALTKEDKRWFKETMRAEIKAEIDEKLTEHSKVIIAALESEATETRKQTFDAIDRIEKLYDVDRRLKVVETKLGIEQT